MKVFFSWSGKKSRAIADIFREWLPSVIQAAEPYFTPEDIVKGARWRDEIAKELERCSVCLIFLTPDNLEAPWLMFEAGAISKIFSESRVCPLLFRVEPSDIKGPLTQFQAAKFDKGEILRVVRMINGELGDNALADQVLNNVFEMWWPKLEEKVPGALSVSGDADEPLRSERDILNEILGLVRAMPRTSNRDQPLHNVLSKFRETVRTYRGDVDDAIREGFPKSHLVELVRRGQELGMIASRWRLLVGDPLNMVDEIREAVYTLNDRLEYDEKRFASGDQSSSDSEEEAKTSADGPTKK